MQSVVHIVRRFSKKEWGGTESVVLNLAQKLEQKNINSPILSTDMLSEAGDEKMDAVTVKRFSYIFPWFGLSQSAKEALEMKGGSPLCLKMFFYLRSLKSVDIIHLHTEHRLGGIGRTIARMKNIPYVVSLHGGKYTLPEEQAAKMRLPFENKWEWGKFFGFLFGSRKVLDDAGAVICVGQSEYEKVKKRYPQKEVVYQPNGICVNEFKLEGNGAAFRTKYDISEDCKVILCLSRIEDQKNQKLLLKSFADLVKSRDEKLKLVLIGSVTVKSYEEELKELADKLNVRDQLILIPGFEPSDPMLKNAYKAADVFVLPSKHEPFGIVILEAWAAGVPVIASNVGGIPGFTECGKNVLLFTNDDQQALNDQLKLLLNDADLRNKLIAAGQHEVETYDWEQISEQTFELYKKLIATKKVNS